MTSRAQFDLGGGLGRAGRGGAIYHLSFRSGSRATGACAHASYEYITREGEYGGPDRDAAIYTESGHIPAWAEDDPAKFWDAADLHERANGRLFVAADFALPCDLSLEAKVELAHKFAGSLTDAESLPYTLAIHQGTGPDGEEHNPHVHLMLSERRNDGIERSPDEWFSRANSASPEDGGAAKSRTFHGPDWVEGAREGWGALVNDALKQAGRDDRVDHRSYERQGIEREPGEHFGPAAASMLDRAGAHDRLEGAAQHDDTDRELAALEAEIARLESTRAELLRDARSDDRAHQSSGGAPDRDDGFSWGR
jgi:hypothetical protein